MNTNPLVSVRIVTYNSSKYVIDALESVKNQTYRKIELIVSDDKSTDDTVAVCDKWLQQNKSRFVRTKLLTTGINTGVVGNCNRSLTECQGEWEMGIAGDDMLVQTAVEDFVSYVKDNPNAEAVSACLIDVNSEGLPLENVKRSIAGPFYCNNRYSAKDQFCILSKCFSGFGAVTFIKTNVIKRLGGYDERFPMLEDYPFFIKYTANGHRIFWMPKIVLKYRHHDSSITGTKQSDNVYFNNYRIRDIFEYRYLYKRERLNSLWRCFLSVHIFFEKSIILMGNDRKSVPTQVVYVLYKTLSPFEWYFRYIALKQNKYNNKYINKQ